ncbi:hypothetical protein [Sphingomonas sp. ID0503]|uniref:hypothetical protein n=1 Tax=Sphingomonas sp. ID0503 TaxID=3399691 RepID=UPI003AFA2FB0
MVPTRKLSVAGVALLTLALAGCKNGDIASELKITRSACPAVAVPAYTGDVTLFDPPASREARAIDVVANISNLTSSCNSGTDPITAEANFEVSARRTNTAGARDVTLPYFATVVRAGTRVTAKSLSRVTLHFDDGAAVARSTGTARIDVSASAAKLPADIEAKINRKRKAGDEDAAIDPMSDPTVRAAVQNASFELLVGFQLTEDQLKYNATR